jgi:medium-chain acyl-[acyl-carrier-protein] hydrolase
VSVNVPACAHEVQLWCIPSAGGSASAYAHWRRGLDRRIRVIALELPGRGRRLRESPLKDIDSAVRDALSFVRPRLTRLFAFFGHSLGAIIAAECCRRLEEEGSGVAQRLFVASSLAPHRARCPETPTQRSDAELIGQLRNYEGTPEEVLRDAELMALVLPAIRADFMMLDTYDYQNTDGCLSCPITAIAAEADAAAPAEELNAWAAHTRGKFDLHRVAGGHFATLRAAEVAQIVATSVFDEA